MSSDKLNLFKENLLSYNYSANTIKNYISALNRFDKWNQLDDKVSEDLLICYFEHLKFLEKSYSSIKISIMALKLYFEFINGYSLKYDFLHTIRRSKKLPDILSISETKFLLDSIDNLKHKTIISMIYSCGLTISECIKLRIRDINTTNMVIVIDNGKERRYVPLSHKLLILLRKYLWEYKLVDKLFIGQSKNEYSARSIQKDLKYALNKCGITKNITVRSLRHSFAAHLVEQGIDLRIIQKILGHKNIRSTQKYSHISSANFAKIVNPFDSF